jgi:hypothetical protein
MAVYIEPQIQNPAPGKFTLTVTLSGPGSQWTSKPALLDGATDWDSAKSIAAPQVLAMAKTLGAALPSGRTPGPGAKLKENTR